MAESWDEEIEAGEDGLYVKITPRHYDSKYRIELYEKGTHWSGGDQTLSRYSRDTAHRNVKDCRYLWLANMKAVRVLRKERAYRARQKRDGERSEWIVTI